MLILFLKATASDSPNPLPLPEKLRRVFMLRVKEAKTDEDRGREQIELEKWEKHAAAESADDAAP